MSDNIRQHKNTSSSAEDILSKLGLNEKETHIYLDLLQNGPRPVAVIAKRARVTRTNGYDLVKNLEKKGLCFSSGTTYGKKIHAHDPAVLKEIIAEKKRSLDHLVEELNDSVHVFKKAKTTPYVHHEVTYLEGVENIKKIFTMMAAPHVSQVYGVGSELELEEYVGRETLEQFHEQRKRNHVHFSVLRAGPQRPSGNAFHDDVTYLREVRIRPKGKVRLKSQLYLFDNTIIFLNLFDKPFATIIRNEPMFIMFHSWYEFIWNASETVVSRKSK
jgi:predicted transcriptional regulator